MAISASTWNAELTTPQTLDHLREFARFLLEKELQTVTNRSKELRLLLRLVSEAYRDDRLVALAGFEPVYSDLDPASESDIRFIRVGRQVSALFSKLTFGAIDRKAVALQSFLRSEEKCRETNHLIRLWRAGGVSLDPFTVETLRRARRLIGKVLDGCQPTFEGGTFRFGPGATSSLRRKDANPIAKARSLLTCAAPLYNHVGVVTSGAPHLVHAHLHTHGPSSGEVSVSIVDAVWDSVPKNFKTERGICKEPDLNVIAQGLLGRKLERVLRRGAGIDIRDQTRNQRLAHQASITGDIATLDLSAASDSIAVELVYELLPLDWASILAAARSPRVRLPDGSVILQEKFSSMGNGYTFPLETLIFWGLCSAALSDRSEKAVVYGDDIIVPSRDAENVIRVLSDCGFAVNSSKSFWDPAVRFRESCGCDYFGGIDVRPTFVRGNLSPRRVALLFNAYAEEHEWDVCHYLWQHYLQGAPHGPQGYGDGHLHWSPFAPCNPFSAYKRERGLDGFLFKSFLARSVRTRMDVADVPDDILLSAVLYVSDRISGLDIAHPISISDESVTYAEPDKDEDGDSIYESKRLHAMVGGLPSYSHTALEWHLGRWWDVVYVTGEKPRLKQRSLSSP